MTYQKKSKRMGLDPSEFCKYNITYSYYLMSVFLLPTSRPLTSEWSLMLRARGSIAVAIRAGERRKPCCSERCKGNLVGMNPVWSGWIMDDKCLFSRKANASVITFISQFWSAIGLQYTRQNFLSLRMNSFIILKRSRARMPRDLL